MPDRRERQPWLHRLVTTVWGNVTALSADSGDMAPEAGRAGAQGLYVDDRRVLSLLVVEVDREAPEPVTSAGAGRHAEFLASARNVGDAPFDPVVEVHRRRTLRTGGLDEEISLVARAATPLPAGLDIRLAADDAPIATVKAGLASATLPPQITDTAVTFIGYGHRTTVTATPCPLSVALDGDVAVLRFGLLLEPQQPASVRLRVLVERTRTSLLDADPGGSELGFDDVRVTGEDPRLEPTFRSSLADLAALVLRDPAAPGDLFLAAGTPWYLTLFGRDSIWAARLALPFGTRLAEGTLRALARRQGGKPDLETAEAPGKIPHEIRRFAGIGSLPPVYYGTVDATALWVLLLDETLSWGSSLALLDELSAPLEAAVGWLLDDAAPGPLGLVRYVDGSGHGLANQGWKDSADAIRFRDGSIATPPIALVEAQAYAADALARGAALLTTAGRESLAEPARARASALRAAIREQFWTPEGYLGLALDGRGRIVDGLASNMGHVLGTGALLPAEVDVVAAYLTGPSLLSRDGLRSLANDNGGYNPLGYHAGSIWTHDTAIAAIGLGQEGRRREAVLLARALLRSAEAFGYRWPELYSGDPAALGRPAAYPAACRPQAWAAAAAPALLSVALGFEPEASTRTLRLRPARPAAFGPMRVEGIRFCGRRIDLSVAADGSVEVDGDSTDGGVTVQVT